MRRSSATLSAAQAGRVASLPSRALASPSRVTALEGFRQRNTALDALFYDVKVVTQDEAVAISPWLAAEGAILIVPPSHSGPITLCTSAEDFAAQGGSNIRSLAVAGVGSSALGSAAFARNIADARGEPVAAVVSGYGLADVAAEALGGFFLFGGLNSLRHAFEWLDRLTEAGAVAEPAPAAEENWLTRRSKDSRAVLELLEDERFAFDLLVGHSKGNLVLSEALFCLKERNSARAKALAAAMSIVTVGAIIAMPRPFRVIDVIGRWDWFGGLNSRTDIAPDHIVEGAWHHTNTELPAHLPVTKTLRQVLRIE